MLIERGTPFEPPVEKKRSPEKRRKKGFDYGEFCKELEKKDISQWRQEARKGYLEQGAEFVVGIHEKVVDTIVFMDKSARPLAGFFRKIWERLYPGETPPKMKFMVATHHMVNPDAAKAEEKSKTPAKLVKKFSTSTDPAFNELYVRSQKIAEIFGRFKDDFEGKKVLLVDEISESGATLVGARIALKLAFPETKRFLVGAMAGFDKPIFLKQGFDIPIPRRGYYGNQDMRLTLGRSMYNQDSSVKEEAGEPIAKAARAVPATETWVYRLRKVGEFETLDEQSVTEINQIIDHPVINKTEKKRLEKIRAAYEKLFSGPKT